MKTILYFVLIIAAAGFILAKMDFDNSKIRSAAVKGKDFKIIASDQSKSSITLK